MRGLEELNAELLKVCETAALALRSYQYGNRAPDLAEKISNSCYTAIAKAKGTG